MIGPVLEPRIEVYHNIWYVDATNGSDNNDGLSWARAKSTIQAAVNAADTHDLILIRGDFTESVTTDDKTGDVALTIQGAGSMTERGLGTEKDCSWKSAGASAAALTVNCPGCRIRNIRFEPNTSAAAIKLMRSGNNDATSFIIENCVFWGNGLYGIDLYGSPSEGYIRNNRFSFMNRTGSAAIASSDVSTAYPYEIVIEHNLFMENKNHINMYANSCCIIGNVFQGTGHVVATTYGLRLIGGNDNMVHGNYMGGDYSTAKYVSATTDEWSGNFSMDVAEAEVEAVSGVTSTVPAA